jgi:hypothetical protein
VPPFFSFPRLPCRRAAGVALKGRIAVAALLVCALAGAGAWAYPRYFGPGATCALPLPTAEVPHIGVGKPSAPLPVVPGWIAHLDRATNPILFKATRTPAELRGVNYEGGVFGQQVVPMHGSIKALAIDGKKFEIRNGSIESGCIDVKGLGKTIVLFSATPSPTATVVLTEAQMALVR